MNSGKLNTLLSFQKRSDGDDGFGNVEPGKGPFVEVFKAWAAVIVEKGSAVQAGGVVVGRMPTKIIVRFDQDTHSIDNTYQIVVADEPDFPPLQVVSAVDPDMSREWVHITGTRGEV